MATTRLRKTFKYPAEEDSDSEPEDLDEEEQEKLINEYIEQDAKKTQGYQRAFLTLPLLLPILYIPPLLAPNSPTSTPYTILLPAITSLLSTAYALHRIPTRFQPKPAQSTAPAANPSPLQKYLDHLNAVLCIILLPFAYRAKYQGRGDDVWFAVMPGVVFVLVYVVRTQLRPVDVGELERLRYAYKGA